MNEELERCPLCDYVGPRLIDRDLGNGFDVKCPRCGHFVILRNLLLTLKDPFDRSKDKLRPYLSAYTKQSLGVPKLHLKNWEELASSHATTSVAARVEKLMNLLSSRTSIPGDYVKLDQDFDYPIIDAAAPNEMQFYRKHLKDLGYIEDVDEAVRLTVEGWGRLQVPPGGFPGRSFVAMSFHDSLTDAF